MTSSAPATACAAPRTFTSSARGTRLLIASLTVGLFASMLAVASPAHAAHVSSRLAYERSVEKSVLTLINKERHAHHLKSVRSNKHLHASARSHNHMMASHNTMSHQVRSESNLGRRVDRAGYNWGNVGENIAWNSRMTRDGMLQVQKLMYNERAPYDGHRQNILSPHYREVGVDVHFDSAHHKLWLTTDFGKKR